MASAQALVAFVQQQQYSDKQGSKDQADEVLVGRSIAKEAQVILQDALMIVIFKALLAGQMIDNNDGGYFCGAESGSAPEEQWRPGCRRV